MKMRVETPVQGFTGDVVGVFIKDGVGHTDDPRALAYFARKGYKVTEVGKEEPETPSPVLAPGHDAQKAKEGKEDTSEIYSEDEDDLDDPTLTKADLALILQAEAGQAPKTRDTVADIRQAIRDHRSAQ